MRSLILACCLATAGACAQEEAAVADDTRTFKTLFEEAGAEVVGEAALGAFVAAMPLAVAAELAGGEFHRLRAAVNHILHPDHTEAIQADLAKAREAESGLGEAASTWFGLGTAFALLPVAIVRQFGEGSFHRLRELARERVGKEGK